LRECYVIFINIYTSRESPQGVIWNPIHLLSIFSFIDQAEKKMRWQKFYHIQLIWMAIFHFQYMNHTSSKEKKIMPNCNQLVTIPARTSLLPNCNQLVYQTDCIKPSIQGFPRISKLIHGQNLNMVSWCETKYLLSPVFG